MVKFTLCQTSDIRAAWIIHFSSKLIFKYQTKEMRGIVCPLVQRSSIVLKNRWDENRLRFFHYYSIERFSFHWIPGGKSFFIGFEFCKNISKSSEKPNGPVHIDDRRNFHCAYIRFTYSLIDIQLLEWISNEMVVHRALWGLKLIFVKQDGKTTAFANKRDSRKMGHSGLTCALLKCWIVWYSTIFIYEVGADNVNMQHTLRSVE